MYICTYILQSRRHHLPNAPLFFQPLSPLGRSVTHKECKQERKLCSHSLIARQGTSACRRCVKAKRLPKQQTNNNNSNKNRRHWWQLFLLCFSLLLLLLLWSAVAILDFCDIMTSSLCSLTEWNSENSSKNNNLLCFVADLFALTPLLLSLPLALLFSPSPSASWQIAKKA